MQSELTTNDFIHFETEPKRATTSQRFANYLIDIILFYILFFIFSFIVALAAPSFFGNVDTGSGPYKLLDRLITLVLYALYMGSVEALFNGKSLGKLVTKTRAVNSDGSKISVYKAFERGFSRAVPFCAFSAFGNPSNPWQDRWTDTMVVEEK